MKQYCFRKNAFTWCFQASLNRHVKSVFRYPLFHSECKNSNTKEIVENVPGTEKSTRKKSKKKIESNETISFLLDHYSKNVWSRCKNRQDFYVADKNAAKDIASAIAESDKDVGTWEMNPGPGVLTESLLECGLTKLRAFETEEAFVKNLKRLAETHKGHLTVVEKNILGKLSDLYHATSQIEKKSWKDGISLKFILTVNSVRSMDFMRHITSKLSTSSSVFNCGRCQFFILMCEQEFNHLMAKPRENHENYRNTTVLYNLFYDMDYLKKFPMTSFLPQFRTTKTSQTTHLHFVKLTPKANLFDTFSSQRKLSELYFFICHHMTKKKDPVIKSLEQWIPFCGPKFIRNGMNVFTRFGDLNPSQILNLFIQFSTLPEYESSPFRAAVKQTHDRLEHRK